MSLIDKLQFGFAKRLPIYLQAESTECGLACLAMVASYHSYDTDLTSLRQRFSLSLKGMTMARLVEIASALHFAARPLRVELDELCLLQRPCILHWNLNHFVVLKEVRRGQVIIHDPASGLRKFSMAEVSAHFTGIALELTPTPAFRRFRERQKIRWREMMGKVIGLKRSLTQIFMIAIALEIFSMGAPLFNQWVIDEAIVTGSRDLLYTLAIGFCLLMVTRTATEALRGWAVTVMGTTLNLQWLANVFKHLVNLPIPYFEKRHMGDIMARFNSINTIQNSLTTSFVESLLDGLMSIATLLMILVYTPLLAAISITAMILYGLLRVSLYGGLRMANEREIVFAAKQQTLFMETIRGIQSIRLFNKGDERVSQWLNIVISQKNCNLRTQRLLLIFKTANQFLFGLENISVILFGAVAVMDNKFSIGMLMAFISYKEQFAKRISSLIDKMYELKMLQLQAARLADIVLTEPERDKAREIAVPTDTLSNPAIAIKNLSFRYAEGEPYLIENCNLTIGVEESVAIVGPSGCGKTTLLKLMLGLCKPSAGEVLVHGACIHQMGLTNYRRFVSAVLQEDKLFAGSIADNICFFALDRDDSLIRDCAIQSAIHEEILAMPMGYNTFIGDMGSALSGGQKQRILLARALYRKPKILFLDEATSNLDVTNERIVNTTIRQLKLTRIVIAHRPETIACADRVVELASGRIKIS